MKKTLPVMCDCSLVVFRSCKEIEEPYLDYIEKQFGKLVLLSGFLVPEPPLDVLEEK